MPLSRTIAAIVACSLMLPVAADAVDKLPPDAAQALAQPDSMTLYSLEPWAMPGGADDRLHDRAVLGRLELDRTAATTATEAVNAALGGWDGLDVGCSDPRVGLRIHTGNAVFDYLLSYQCHEAEIYKDGKRIARVGIYGDPRMLDDLLAAKKIPLSRSGQAMR